MYLFQIDYLLLLDKAEAKKMREFVAAPDIESVWKYYRGSIEGDNICFEGIFKIAPIVRILRDETAQGTPSPQPTAGA